MSNRTEISDESSAQVRKPMMSLSYRHSRINGLIVVAFAILFLLSASVGTMWSSRQALPKEEVRELEPDLPEHPLLQAASPFFLVAAGSSSVASKGLEHLLRPILLEVGVVVLCQAVGLPLISKLGVMARKIRWMSLAKNLRPLRRLPVGKHLIRHGKVIRLYSGRTWKAFGAVYSKTSLSKIVNRSKKLVKMFMHQHEDEH
jgi:hypothetical protein